MSVIDEARLVQAVKSDAELERGQFQRVLVDPFCSTDRAALTSVEQQNVFKQGSTKLRKSIPARQEALLR